MLRVSSVRVSARSLSSVSLSLSHSLALAGSQRPGRRLADGNVVYFLVQRALLAAERQSLVVHAPCSGRRTGIRELVAPFTLRPMMLAPC